MLRLYLLVSVVGYFQEKFTWAICNKQNRPDHIMARATQIRHNCKIMTCYAPDCKIQKFEFF